MFLQVNGLKVHYLLRGEGENIILLHGWGGSTESFAPVFKYLAQKFRVISIDLPGFGQSQKPGEVWGTRDYAEFLKSFMDTLGIEKATLIGHSFGGRISIYFAAHQPDRIKKMVLVNSAGLIKKRPLSYHLKVYTYKVLKKVVTLLPFAGEEAVNRLRGMFGSADYRQAGPMRKILVKIVNEDLKPLLKKIQAPTLLIWGEQDEITPVEFGRIMEREIDDAGLVVLKNAGHFSYLDRLNQFLIIIDNFLGGGPHA